MLQTKFGDHPSFTSVQACLKVFLFLAIEAPTKGANQINMSKFDKSLIKNATDKVW
jgi:hypothetical protein